MQSICPGASAAKKQAIFSNNSILVRILRNGLWEYYVMELSVRIEIFYIYTLQLGTQ